SDSVPDYVAMGRVPAGRRTVAGIFRDLAQPRLTQSHRGAIVETQLEGRLTVVTVVTYKAALASLSSSKKRHLLLGNGFSIALKPDIFSYGSLYENADFSAAPHVTRLFDALATQDF